MHLRTLIAKNSAETQSRNFCVLERARCCCGTGSFSEGGGGRMGVATAPEPRAYAGAAGFPRASTLPGSGVGDLHGDECPSNRVARCMRRVCTSGADWPDSGRLGGPSYGLLYSDFAEHPF